LQSLISQLARYTMKPERNSFPQPPWWLNPPSATDPVLGLSAQRAAEMRRRYGENRFVQRREPPLWWQYLAHFRNPLVLILLLASVASAVLGELANFLIISVIVLHVDHRAHQLGV
jgi:Mg2+-importing ATPase